MASSPTAIRIIVVEDIENLFIPTMIIEIIIMEKTMIGTGGEGEETEREIPDKERNNFVIGLHLESRFM